MAARSRWACTSSRSTAAMYCRLGDVHALLEIVVGGRRVAQLQVHVPQSSIDDRQITLGWPILRIGLGQAEIDREALLEFIASQLHFARSQMQIAEPRMDGRQIALYDGIVGLGFLELADDFQAL